VKDEVPVVLKACSILDPEAIITSPPTAGALLPPKNPFPVGKS